jgi:hypothetical protein
MSESPESTGMKEFRLGDQNVLYDREATIAAYKRIPVSGADRCKCLYCQNFARQRGIALSADLLALLTALGIDPAKEQEVYDLGPQADGTRWQYGGWFYFIGDFIERGSSNIQFRKPGEFEFGDPGPRNQVFPHEKTLAVDFLIEIPWILPERPE